VVAAGSAGKSGSGGSCRTRPAESRLFIHEFRSIVAWSGRLPRPRAGFVARRIASWGCPLHEAMAGPKPGLRSSLPSSCVVGHCLHTRADRRRRLCRNRGDHFAFCRVLVEARLNGPLGAGNCTLGRRGRLVGGKSFVEAYVVCVAALGPVAATQWNCLFAPSPMSGGNAEETEMKLSGVLLASAALCGALVISDPAEAYRDFRGAGWHRAGWGGGWHRAGWRGARWGGWHRAGWRGARWSWAGNRWGWNRGWGWPAAAGLGVAASSPWWGSNYPYYDYGSYPYYSYGYGYPYGYGLGAAATAPVTVAAAATAPLMTGRSVAAGPVQMGNYCTTPAKTCLLTRESWVGNGCSCRIPGGRARGSVTQ
jgi:hypothetical protein